MGRPKDAERRRELLDGCRDYADEHGLFGLTLRPLADHLGTSTRNLLHHFGSREALITEIVDRTLDDYLTIFRQLLSRIREFSTDLPPTAEHVATVVAEGLDYAWAQAHLPEGRRRTAMFFEIYTAATRDPDLRRRFLDPVVTEWLNPLAAALATAGTPPETARSLASRILAVHRGLLLEYLALGDDPVTEAAHRDAVRAARSDILDHARVR
ncbi:TetR/AcrR family transcriptional regulator [Nocardia otitidiscaviarum]|uniref:TetR/AcrR family transcriptional regulator n=1 Tax=Nocardia otitidiscaviarum TaxID=1823 RepID=UPI0009DDA86D|nr:TetR/AcrR family transcriptional regulator [Nocardia otitidiscaviarum]MBF6487589.1 TetR/AcrR family transcriptional regulator [Nocardia otitidiscaviarum]